MSADSESLPVPLIDAAKCIGCHLCVDTCPTQALEQSNQIAVVRYPERCTYCTLCEDLCPEHAIALPFLIVLAHPPSVPEEGK